VPTNKGTTRPVIQGYVKVEHKGMWNIQESHICTFTSGTA